MRVDLDTIHRLCREQKSTVSEVISKAGVSRNAFYALARKTSILPDSLQAISRELGVAESAILTDKPSPEKELLNKIDRLRHLQEHHPQLEFDNARHTMLLLDEKPVDRLRRALQRGRPLNLR